MKGCVKRKTIDKNIKVREISLLSFQNIEIKGAGSGGGEGELGESMTLTLVSMYFKLYLVSRTCSAEFPKLDRG